MHMCQGKGGGVQLAEALTWLILNYKYQTCGKKRTRVHYLPPTNYTTMVPLSTSPREGTPYHSHLSWCVLEVSDSSCLIIRYMFQVVHDRGCGYSNSFVKLA